MIEFPMVLEQILHVYDVACILLFRVFVNWTAVFYIMKK